MTQLPGRGQEQAPAGHDRTIAASLTPDRDRYIDSGLTTCKIALMSAAPVPRTLSKEQLILELLIGHRAAMYGLEIVSASRGRLKRGTVYVTLARMEDKGLVASRQEDPPAEAGGLPRRLYTPTALGRRFVQAHAQLAKLLPEFAR
jgi:PadR family transcriptional regulator, regulatory protein PadR